VLFKQQARWRVVGRSLWVAGFCALALQAAAQGLPSRTQVEQAMEQIRQDPNLPGKRMEKSLVFKESTQENRDTSTSKDTESDSSSNWAEGFGSWLSQAGRVLIWVFGGIAVVFVAFGLRHWMRVRADAGQLSQADLPSHVGQLDIRPQSLPPEVGTVAWQLWQQGQQREALSLLYRATLSRLVHQHAVPVQASSTEHEVMELVQHRLQAQPRDFVLQLVRIWQRGVYGAHMPDDGQVQALCGAFSQQLPGTSPLTPGAV
jgi:Domain of unknown function (DUF4129)